MVKGFRARIAVAVLVPATLGWLTVTPPPPAQAQEPEMRVQLNEITPAVTADAGRITASGSVRNTGSVRLTDVKASLWISDNPLTSRGDLKRVASSDRAGLEVLPGNRITYPTTLVADISDELRPDAHGTFDVRVPVQRLIRAADIEDTGTYVVGVDVRGTVEETGERHTWRERAFLPWVRNADGDDAALTPVEVAYLLPLTAEPRMTDDRTLLGAREQSPAELFAADGRLSRLLDIGAEYGLSYLMDPSLLELAGTVQEGYRFSDDGPDSEADRTGGARKAALFLDRARGLLGSQDALMLPYADPDLPALERNGLAGRFSTAVDRAEQAAQRYGTNPDALAWPGDGFASAPMLSTAAANGTDRVLLRSGALPDRRKDTEPVVSLPTDAGSVTGLVSDPALLGSGPAGGSDGLQRRQRLLAETALVAMRGGPESESRRMVATLPRSWDGSGADALLSAATGGEVSWLRQISASALLSQPPTAYGGDLTYPDHQRRRELGGDLMRQLHQLDGQADRYLELLADPQTQRGTVDREFLRAASTAWRSAPRRGNRLATEMTEVLSRANNAGVEIIAPRTVTLSQHRGRFPVTVSNDLDQTIDVEVDVTAAQDSRLRLAQVSPVRVPRWRKDTAGVTATAQESGTYQVTAQLRTTEDHRPVGRPVTFQVRVTGFGQVGWAIIASGVGLLVLAMAVRVVRRVRARRREQDGDPASEQPGEHSGERSGKDAQEDAGPRGDAGPPEEREEGDRQRGETDTGLGESFDEEPDDRDGADRDHGVREAGRDRERHQERTETDQEDGQVTDRTQGAEPGGDEPRE